MQYHIRPHTCAYAHPLCIEISDCKLKFKHLGKYKMEVASVLSSRSNGKAATQDAQDNTYLDLISYKMP